MNERFLMSPFIALSEHMITHGWITMTARGFTLFDLLISFTILSILIAVGVPSFSAQLNASRLDTSTQELLDSVNFARSQAVFRNARVTMKSKATWNEGWDIFIDNNNNAVLDAGEQALQTYDKNTSVLFDANTPVKHYISFIGTGESRLAKIDKGGGFQAGTIKICLAHSGAGNALVLSRSGRPKLKPISSAECAAQ